MRCAMNKDDVVARISQLRTKVGLSARDLSLRIGKNSAYISRLESKMIVLSPPFLLCLKLLKPVVQLRLNSFIMIFTLTQKIKR